jgi:hypothetical protein
MATQADVRRIALALPDTVESKTDFAFAVVVNGKEKAFAWAWKERVHPKKPRVRNPEVLVFRVANLVDKDLINSSDPEKFIYDPHYNGYSAVIVRLAKIRVPELRLLLTEARLTLISPKKRR